MVDREYIPDSLLRTSKFLKFRCQTRSALETADAN